MAKERKFTVVDGALGPVVYRISAESVDALRENLASGLNLSWLCALDAATAAWGGCITGFAEVPLVIVPGDHAVLFFAYAELA